ncbi:MAG: lipopolysaccharide kinase InaA family protein [Zoogloeaceae bacterium]|jgi:hypothetical protein|nr:lipopolysaccharide kinase InaA family protein [Zoogloeaceae bacterium]
MRDFIAETDRPLLERQGLATFEALWRLDLPTVDAANVDRGGWSKVCRLEIEGQGFFLKRQKNHRTRSFYTPFGEPTFARELRNIERYRRRGVPAVQAVFYAERHLSGADAGLCACLLTRALDDWRDLALCLAESAHDAQRRQHLLTACGHLARKLHGAGLIHCCFYPRHIFIRETGARCEACLIDLEKTRPLLPGRRDRIKDLEQFLRHCPPLTEGETRLWLAAYLACPPEADKVSDWLAHLAARRQDKESR